jgi:hypothetical protein
MTRRAACCIRISLGKKLVCSHVELCRVPAVVEGEDNAGDVIRVSISRSHDREPSPASAYLCGAVDP